VIAVDGVSVSFGGPDRLREVSLEIQEPETLAIMGANGAGKTTLLKLIAGLTEPDSGTVAVDGVVGFAPEDPEAGLFAETVAEEVAFFPRNRGLDVQTRRQAAMAAMDISEIGDRDPFSLSVGEQRRVSIAAALAGGPDVLVLDEPTRGLDAAAEGQLAEHLDQLDLPVVLSTHAAEFAYASADRVGVLIDGELRRRGPARAVLTDEAFLESAGIRPPGIARWARDRGIDPPPGDLAEAIAASEATP